MNKVWVVEYKAISDWKVLEVRRTRQEVRDLIKDCHGDTNEYRIRPYYSKDSQ